MHTLPECEPEAHEHRGRERERWRIKDSGSQNTSSNSFLTLDSRLIVCCSSLLRDIADIEVNTMAEIIFTVPNMKNYPHTDSRRMEIWLKHRKSAFRYLSLELLFFFVFLTRQHSFRVINSLCVLFALFVIVILFGPTWVNDPVKKSICVLFRSHPLRFVICFVSCNLHSASSSFIACLNIQRTAFIIKRNERHIMPKRCS